MNRRMLVIATAISIVLGGCETTGDKVTSYTNAAAPKPLLPAYEALDLPGILDPDRVAESEAGPSWAKLEPEQKVDRALAAFHSAHYPPDTERRRRDEVQERILGASNQMCSRYITYLQTINSNGNFVLGSLATVSGAAGAVVTGGASQALAAAAGALSGVRAEFNQDYFSNLTVAVLSNGIKLQRQQVYEQIAKYGQTKDVAAYSVEAAIKDALYYHAQCSLIAGVEKAGDSIKLATDPGLDEVNRVLAKLNRARAIVDQHALDPDDVAGSNGAGGLLLMAGTPLGTGAPADVKDFPTVVLAQENSILDNLNAVIQGQISKLTHLDTAATTAALKKAVDDAHKAVQAEVNKCTPAASAATLAYITATGNRAAATTDAGQKVADQAITAAAAQADAVSLKIRSAEKAFDLLTSGTVVDLQKADAAAEKAKGNIPAADVLAAQKTLATAATIATGC